MSPKRLLGVCVDSIESGQAAASSDADRIELCAALSEGGLTPTLGMFAQLKEKIPQKTKIFVMLRPRRGTDFNYSEDEMLSILDDLQEFKKRGADGFVFGALKSPQEIDRESCQRVVDAASPLPVTFHRAFDVLLGDPEHHLQTIISLGFKRILTSGQHSNAELGLENISKWNEKYGDQIIIMPGAGVNSGNLSKIIRQSGCQEFHSSCKNTEKIALNNIIGDLERNVLTMMDTVKTLVSILRDPQPE